MEALGRYAGSLCMVLAGVSVVGYLTEGTKLKGQMKFLLGLILAAAVIFPLTNGNLSMEMPQLSEYELSDEDGNRLYLAELEKQTEANVTSILSDQLHSAGINFTKLETSINISDIDSISISSVTVSCDDFEAASAIIRNSLGAETEVLNGDTEQDKEA